MVWDEIEAEENLDGLSEEQLATFRERAVPVPGGVLRGEYAFTNDARRDIPSTIIATGYSAADYQKYASEHPEWVVPRRHPRADATSPGSTCRRATGRCGRSRTELAKIIGEVATTAGAGAHTAGDAR